MKIKYLGAILASIVILFATTTVLKASTKDSNQTFYCQNEGLIPTTVAKRADGEDLNIFHWRSEILPKSLNPQTLCEEVSQKLQSHATEGNQLSSFRTHDFNGVPLICAEENIGECSLVLFSLNPSISQPESNLILEQILDDSLKGEKTTNTERGVQSYGYKVNFWNLLGF